MIILLLKFIYNPSKKFIVSSLGFLLFFSNGIISNELLKFIEYPWKRIDIELIKKADAIIVLSSGISLPPGNSKIIELNDTDRFFSGLKLFKAGKANKLIFTGGSNPFKSKIPLVGDVFMKESQLLGISKENLRTTTQVFNTKQEALEVKKLIQKENTLFKKNIILITSAYHMKRAKKIFERNDFYVLPYPVDFKAYYGSYKNYFFDPLNFFPSSSSLSKSSLAIREIIGRIVYRSW